MICFPNAKINLGLNVVSRRDDGFHEIDTVMVPVVFSDMLEIIPSAAGNPAFSRSGLPVPGPKDENLCVRALDLFREKYSDTRVHMHLHKVIPPGSGLGGGSSNAAFTLRVLNDVMQKNMSRKDLMKMASQLGSDCPFFILNRPVRATGRGEILEETSVGLSGKKILIVIPHIHVSTAWAYSRVIPGRRGPGPSDIIRKDIGHWKDNLVNDFEGPVFAEYPVLKEIRDRMYGLGAEYAAMSGSGSAIYGIFGSLPGNAGEEFKACRTIVTSVS